VDVLSLSVAYVGKPSSVSTSYGAAGMTWQTSLAFLLSLSKRQPPSQRVEYTGVIVDTIAGRLYIPEKKLAKLRSCLDGLAGASVCTTRELLSVRGRVRHYSLCIDYIGPLVPLLSVDGEDSERLDVRLPLPDEVKSSASLILELVDRFAARGAALWQPVASSVYGAFLRGDTAGTPLAVLSWDSSIKGVGTLLRLRENPEGQLIITGLRSRTLSLPRSTGRHSVAVSRSKQHHELSTSRALL